MATESYWQQRRESLLKKYGAGAPPTLLSGPGSALTVSELLECRVVGLTEEAGRVLDKLLPSLRLDLSGERWRKGRSDQDGKEIMASISEAAHIAWWLKNDAFDPDLGKAAIRWRHEMRLLWGAPLTSPQLLRFMLICVESGQPEYAVQLYEENQKRLLPIPPSGFTFTRNARDVLFAHLRLGKDASRGSVLEEAERRFLANATHWEKRIQPIPYVGILEAARVVAAARSLRGKGATIADVAQAVR